MDEGLTQGPWIDGAMVATSAYVLMLGLLTARVAFTFPDLTCKEVAFDYGEVDRGSFRLWQLLFSIEIN
jgi:hypothetical protein